MEMYRCNDCKLEFFTPEAVEESRGEFWGIPCSETMYYCPRCGSEDYEEFESGEEVVSEYTEDDYYDALLDDMMAMNIDPDESGTETNI